MWGQVFMRHHLGGKAQSRSLVNCGKRLLFLLGVFFGKNRSDIAKWFKAVIALYGAVTITVVIRKSKLLFHLKLDCLKLDRLEPHFKSLGTLKWSCEENRVS